MKQTVEESSVRRMKQCSESQKYFVLCIYFVCIFDHFLDSDFIILLFYGVF